MTAPALPALHTSARPATTLPTPTTALPAPATLHTTVAPPTITVSAPSTAPTGRILTEVGRMIGEILGGEDALLCDVTMDTSFHEDLALESIDLVTLASLLAARYGRRVNLAEYLAEKDLNQVINLTVGDIVGYVASRTDQRRSG